MEISQGMLKHFRGHVLSIMAVEHTPDDECVNALEVALVQFGEPSRVFLRGLDQQAFLIHYLYINAEYRRKVTVGRKNQADVCQNLVYGLSAHPRRRTRLSY